MKEMKFHSVFLDENLNMVEIPENIQKIIERQERRYVEKLEELNAKVGVFLKHLSVIEKALELACDEILGFYCSDYCGTEKDCQKCSHKSFYTPEHFKREALKLTHQQEDKGE